MFCDAWTGNREHTNIPFSLRTVVLHQMQVFCSKDSPFLTAFVRLALPLLFLTGSPRLCRLPALAAVSHSLFAEGVAHRSILLDFNGGERLVVAHIVSCLKMPSLFVRPLFLFVLCVHTLLVVLWGSRLVVQWAVLFISLSVIGRESTARESMVPYVGAGNPTAAHSTGSAHDGYRSAGSGAKGSGSGAPGEQGQHQSHQHHQQQQQHQPQQPQDQTRESAGQRAEVEQLEREHQRLMELADSDLLLPPGYEPPSLWTFLKSMVFGLDVFPSLPPLPEPADGYDAAPPAPGDVNAVDQGQDALDGADDAAAGQSGARAMLHTFNQPPATQADFDLDAAPVDDPAHELPAHDHGGALVPQAVAE